MKRGRAILCILAALLKKLDVDWTRRAQSGEMLETTPDIERFPEYSARERTEEG